MARDRCSVEGSTGVHHVCGSGEVLAVAENIFAGTEVTFVNGSTGSSPFLDPLTTEAAVDLIGCWTLIRIRVHHGFDNLVHSIGVMIINHESRRFGEFLLDVERCANAHRAKRIDFGVGHAQRSGGFVVVLRDRVSIRVAAEGATVGAPGQAWENLVELA